MIPLPPLFFALILSITDGDTVRVRIAIWQHQTVEIAVRLAGVDTPEIYGACPRERELAREAKAAVVRLLPVGSVVQLHSVTEDKYFDRVGAAIRTAEGIDLAEHLLQIGLAKSYDGKKKRGWC